MTFHREPDTFPQAMSLKSKWVRAEDYKFDFKRKSGSKKKARLPIL